MLAWFHRGIEMLHAVHLLAWAGTSVLPVVVGWFMGWHSQSIIWLAIIAALLSAAALFTWLHLTAVRHPDAPTDRQPGFEQYGRSHLEIDGLKYFREGPVLLQSDDSSAKLSRVVIGGR
jgi:hypothetical protein